MAGSGVCVCVCVCDSCLQPFNLTPQLPVCVAVVVCACRSLSAPLVSSRGAGPFFSSRCDIRPVRLRWKSRRHVLFCTTSVLLR